MLSARLFAAAVAVSFGTAFVPCAAAGRGPSFSCRAPQLTPTEKRVCADATLARLDVRLDAAASLAFRASPRALELSADQAHWLRSVRNACDSRACLAGVYRERIAYLEADERASARASDGVADVFEPAHPTVLPADLRARLAAEAGLSPACLVPWARVDLGDGRPSIFAQDCLRGNDNGAYYLFHPADDGYRLVLSILSDGYVSFEDERFHGLKRLRFQQHGSCCDFGYVYLDFDGNAYRPAGCGNEIDDAKVHFVISPCRRASSRRADTSARAEPRSRLGHGR